MIRKHRIQAIAGHRDWQTAQGSTIDLAAPLSIKNRDTLLRLPQMLSFRIGDYKGIAFYGRYIQDLPGLFGFCAICPGNEHGLRPDPIHEG